MSKSVVVVGAGVSGLVCARRLSQVGVEVTVVDALRTAGGRVQTDVIDGFRIDRGFQVYLTGYPSCKLELDEKALDLRAFEPGCLVWDGKKQHEIHKDGVVQMLADRWISFGDMLKTASMSMDIKALGEGGTWGEEDMSIEAYLRGRGFGDRFIDRFVRPFFGGVLLDTSLSGSVLPFLYYWKMFDEGDTVVPALGMGEIPKQLAEAASRATFRFGVRVDALVRSGDYVTGVRLADGSTLEGDAVIVATDAKTASTLTGLPGPKEFRSCVTVSYSTDASPISDPILVLNGTGTGLVHHVAPMSKVSPGLAPKGRHLVSATLLGNPSGDDMSLAKSVRYELRDWFKSIDVDSWVPVSVNRVPMAQMAQPVGFRDHLMSNNPEAALFVAGEGTTYAGLDGAFRSAHDVSAAVLSWFKQPAAV